jgi:hypothetical protein
MRGTRAAVRGSLLLAGCAGLTGTAWWLAAGPLLRLLRTADPARLPLQDVLLGLCSAVLLGCVAWLVATTTLTLTAYVARSAAPRNRHVAALGRAVDRRCPRVTRLLVGTALGVALTTAVATPALADPPGPRGLTGLALPDRTTGSALSAAARTVALRHASPAPRVVVVHPGDSLWTIAARLLPGHASDADISDAWHRLRRRNTDRLGPDPDLILPGTSLEVPGTLAPHRKDAP